MLDTFGEATQTFTLPKSSNDIRVLITFHSEEGQQTEISRELWMELMSELAKDEMEKELRLFNLDLHILTYSNFNALIKALCKVFRCGVE